MLALAQYEKYPHRIFSPINFYFIWLTSQPKPEYSATPLSRKIQNVWLFHNATIPTAQDWNLNPDFQAPILTPYPTLKIKPNNPNLPSRALARQSAHYVAWFHLSFHWWNLPFKTFWGFQCKARQHVSSTHKEKPPKTTQNSTETYTEAHGFFLFLDLTLRTSASAAMGAEGPAMSKSHCVNSLRRPLEIWGWSRRHTRSTWYRLIDPSWDPVVAMYLENKVHWKALSNP